MSRTIENDEYVFQEVKSSPYDDPDDKEFTVSSKTSRAYICSTGNEAMAALITGLLNEYFFDKSYPPMIKDFHGVQQLIDICHGDAKRAGWYTDIETGLPKELNVGERMALIHSEISEAFEAYRKRLRDDHLPNRWGLEVELADAIIRIADFAGAEGLDLAGAIKEKLEYNRSRADHKIENRRLENGKKC